MLAIDDIKKLAKMQELLLARTSDNRETNLDKYKSIVFQIDEDTFSRFLSEIKQYNEHNQNLEDEIKFLEQIKSLYQQILEQQLGFKRVCELYGNDDLQLSDLSQVDIEYIDSRINTINGYLINKKNIEINKNKLQNLNEELINEEKNREYISNKLLEFEKILRNNFINAEGRIISDGKLEYTSVISEYSKIGINFKEILTDVDSLAILLNKINEEILEVDEKLKIAEICYSNIPSVESKQILNEIRIENFKVKYRLIMIKILNLLVKNYDDFDKFREKREQLLDLIKHRVTCLDKLSIKISIDPFTRTKIEEQLEMFYSLSDGTKRINHIKKEIATLTDCVEQMEVQNREYMISINDKKDIFKSTTSMNDIDISGITLDIEEYIDDGKKQEEVSDNQVVSIKNVPGYLNMDIIKQKTSKVIVRVNEMMSEEITKMEIEDDIVVENMSPELVIVPSNDDIYLESNTLEIEDLNGERLEKENNTELQRLDNDWFKNWSDSLQEQQNNSVEEKNYNVEEELKDNSSIEENDVVVDEHMEVEDEISYPTLEDSSFKQIDSDIFLTVNPFEETELFTDKVEDGTEKDDFKIELDESNNEDNFFGLEMDLSDDRDADVETESIDFEAYDDSESFWPIQEGEIENNVDIDSEEDIVPTFEEQIGALLADDDVKIKKRVA